MNCAARTKPFPIRVLKLILHLTFGTRRTNFEIDFYFISNQIKSFHLFPKTTGPKSEKNIRWQQWHPYHFIRSEFKQVWRWDRFDISDCAVVFNLPIFLIDFFVPRCVLLASWNAKLNFRNQMSERMEKCTTESIRSHWICNKFYYFHFEMCLLNEFHAEFFFCDFFFYFRSSRNSNRTDSLNWFNWDILNLVYVWKLYFPVSFSYFYLFHIIYFDNSYVGHSHSYHVSAAHLSAALNSKLDHDKSITNKWRRIENDRFFNFSSRSSHFFSVRNLRFHGWKMKNVQ